MYKADTKYRTHLALTHTPTHTNALLLSPPSVTAADVRIFEPSSGRPLCDRINVLNNGVSSGGRRIECVVAKSLMAGDYEYKVGAILLN